MKRLLFCAAAMSAVAACTTPTPVEPVVPIAPIVAVDQNNPLFWPMYTRMAASSDQFEIQSGQLALQMSQNPAVRQFAQMLIDHHQQTTAQLASAAQSAGLPVPPPAMTGAHAQMLANLRAAPMGSFDMAFRDAQIQAHQEALALHQGYATSGDIPALRTTAGAAVPIIQQHLNMAQSLAVMAPPMGRNPGERG
jgi:putative membrane protein